MAKLLFPLDMNIYVSKEIKISCKCYRKPTDTSTFLYFRSCASLQDMKCIAHRPFRSSSNCKNFDEALKTNSDIWLKNQ